jgi:hypothetical protein
MSTDSGERSNATKGNNGDDKVPETGSQEDFGSDAETKGPGGEKRKSGGKEETGATEAGNEDKGAKM